MSINDKRFAQRPNAAMKQSLPPARRHQPLPEHHPKPRSEDPDAPARIAAIVEHPSYREADQDPDFLRRDDMRGVRLVLDYEKPQQLLAEHNVAHTIVVFGSTRIPEPDAARRNREVLTAALSARPGDPALGQRLAIAERIEAKSRYYEIAREFGRLVGSSGDKAIGGRVMVMTGGGPGIMEAANRGARDAAAQSIGLNITLPHEQFPNPYVSPGLCFSFHYFAVRKLHFLMRARALVAFPGGFGTLDEIFEVLNLAQTRKIDPVPVILVGKEYWQRVIDVDFLVSEGAIDPEDRELFWYAETAADIWRDILLWYELRGMPLLPHGLVEEICGPVKTVGE